MKRSFFFLLLLGFPSAKGQDSPEGRAILEKAARASQSGPSYRAEFTGKMEDRATGLDRKMELSGFVLSQPPDKLRAEMKVGPTDQWTIRDGPESWLYYPGTKKYRRFTSTAASIANFGSLDPNSLFGVLTERLQSVQIAPDENVTFDTSPVRCYVLTANYEPAQGGGQRRATYWIDQMNFIVLRRTVNVPVRNAQYTERTLDVALTKLVLAPTLAGNEFMFTPPEGATAMVNPAAPPAPASSGSPQGAYRIGNGISAPHVVSKREPEYSEEARRARLEGTVTLSLVVDATGVPMNLRVLKGLGLGLDEKALEAVGTWQFAPGQKEGKPVPILATIQVNFRLLPEWQWHLTRVAFDPPKGATVPSVVKSQFPRDFKAPDPGSVTLTLDVDEHGKPINLHVEKSSNPDSEQEVIKAAREWRFNPGLKDGTPISVPLTIEFSQVVTLPAQPPAPAAAK